METSYGPSCYTVIKIKYFSQKIFAIKCEKTACRHVCIPEEPMLV